LVAKSHASGPKVTKHVVGEYDWGNSKGRDDVCWRCGHQGHVARLCVADMPQDVKQKVFDHALTAVFDFNSSDEELFAFISSVGHPPGEFAW